MEQTFGPRDDDEIELSDHDDDAVDEDPDSPLDYTGPLPNTG